jgi:hypothetical protein
LLLLLLLVRSDEGDLLLGRACHPHLLEVGREIGRQMACAGGLLHGYQLLLSYSWISLQNGHVALLLLLLQVLLLRQMVSKGLVPHLLLLLLHQGRIHLN